MSRGVTDSGDKPVRSVIGVGLREKFPPSSRQDSAVRLRDGRRGAEARERARAAPHSPNGTTPTRAAASSAALRRSLDLSGGLTFVDLFCGVGGFSLGCIQAGLVPLAAFDNDVEAIARYETNLGPHAHELDLTHATAADVLGFTNGVSPDIVVGGPPCQGFSFLGKRDPTDERSALTLSFARIVLELKPRAFAMENVPGIFTMGSIAADVRDALRTAGYENTDWVRLDASQFGVPQKRRRAVLLGSLSGVKPTIEDLKPSNAPTVAVGDALRGLPRPRARSTVHRNAYVAYPKSARPGSYDAEMRSAKDAVTGCQVTVHEEETVSRFKQLDPGEVDEPTSCQRLDPKGLAPALRAGKRDRTACRPVHPYAWRVITVREAARLHSFPDWFDFSEIVSLGHVQIGNSVPPRLGAAIARWLVAAAGVERSATATVSA